MSEGTSDAKKDAMQQKLQEAAVRRQKALAGLGGIPERIEKGKEEGTPL